MDLLIGRTHLDEVNLVEAVVTPRSLDVEDGNNVLMVEVAQQLHLSESTKTEHGVIKWGDLLDGYFLAGWFVDRRAGRR